MSNPDPRYDPENVRDEDIDVVPDLSEYFMKDMVARALSLVKFPTIPKTKVVNVVTNRGSYKFSYAPMEAILSAIRQPLADQGLSLTQSCTEKECTTRLYHSSGQFLESTVPLNILEDDTPQQVGSKITYARRYGITLICCLAADEDDDANIAEGNHVSDAAKSPLSKAITPKTGVEDVFDEAEIATLIEAAKMADMDACSGKIEEAIARIEFYANEESETYNEAKTYMWGCLSNGGRKAIKAYREKKAKDEAIKKRKEAESD